MDRAPLPPHERAWRHPSELAEADRVAAASEPPSASARALALVGGTTGVALIAVGLFALTPGGTDAPSTVSATTTPRVAGIAPVLLTTPSASSTGITTVLRATPVGDGTIAVTTHRALASSIAEASGDPERTDDEPTDPMEGMVVDTGDRLAVVASVLDEGSEDGLAVIELVPDDERPRGLDIAARVPDDHEIVTVLVDPPIEVAFHEVDDLDVADGTVVLDARGALVGLCADPVSDVIPASATLTVGPDQVRDRDDVVATTAPG